MVRVDSVVEGSERRAVGVTPLCDKLGLDASARERRLLFLGIGSSDCEVLRELAPFLESVCIPIIDAFYVHLFEFQETARFLTDETAVERLKALQRQHFVELACGDYGADYFESRLRVGLVHARIGLQPHWYLGSYLVQSTHLQDRLREAFASDQAYCGTAQLALSKVIMLDMALATDAYIHAGFVDRTVAESHAQAAERAQRALTERDEEAARREQLLHMVVHDIRSPVTAMMATARVGLRRWRETTEAPGKQFALIEESGGGVLRIIDNMVATARTAGGELAVRPEAFNVSETVRACAEALQPFAEQNDHSLIVLRGQSIDCEVLDPVLVRRVVSNLMVNAVRHTPGGTTVRASCEATKDSVRICVEDDGPGIPHRQRDGLFQGGRALPEKREATAGTWVDTGLGLPFCALACRSMGGTIELLNASRQGACFVVVLPRF